MESEDPGKKLEDILKNLKGMSFSYTTVPINTFKFPTHKQETIQEELVRYNKIEEVIEAMTDYPQAKRMLDNLYGKQ